MALTYTPTLDPSLSCPDFELMGMDDKMHTRSEFAGSKALLVIFICNHCPYVKAIEDRLIELGKFMKAEGLQMVAIGSNDADNYPEDSFENLKKRWKEKNYPFHYLYDESQVVARSFGAVCTPDFFLFDENLTLTYRGRLDDSWKDPEKVKRQELKLAIEAQLTGHTIDFPQTPSMGCNIKWKTT